MFTAKKLNTDEIEIIDDGFVFDGLYYNFSDFIRVHNNPWMNESLYPSFIHGVYCGSPLENIAVEIVGGELVNVYELCFMPG